MESPANENGSEEVVIQKGTIKDVWKRPSKRPLPDCVDVITRFEIPYARVLPTENDTGNASKKYVVYDVSVCQVSNLSDDMNPTTIERRYTHFLQLFESLKKDFPAHMNNTQFPKKVLIGNFNAELIADRAAAFEVFLDYIVGVSELRDSQSFLDFLQNDELSRACKLLDERRVETAVPILENCFQLVNKVFLDKSKPVLLLLCRLVAACATSGPLPHPMSEKWAELALRRYEHVCDTELLVLYIPLLHTCSYLWWQKGRDNDPIKARLDAMGKRGIKVTNTLTLTQAIHTLEPRSELY